MRSTIEYDPVVRKGVRVHETAWDDEFHVEQVQDVTPLVEWNKASFNQIDERAPWYSGQHVASIPMVIVEELMRSGVWYDDKALHRWLDDPDNRVWRTRPGKLSR